MIEILDLNHVSLVLLDLDASMHFYPDILGMKEVPRPPAAQYKIAWLLKGLAESDLVDKF